MIQGTQRSIQTVCRCTVLLFNVGKMVVIAINQKVMAIAAFTAIVMHLQQCGFPDIGFSGMRVENYASTYYLRHGLDLNHVQAKYADIMWWESNFAGANMHGPGCVTMLLFKSGKIVITGARNTRLLTEAADWCDYNLKDSEADHEDDQDQK